MKTVIIICCLVTIALEAVLTEKVNQTPNHALHRQKRFWGVLPAIIGGIKTGAKVVDVVNRIFEVDDTTFGRVVSRIAMFDPPESRQMYDALDTMMHDTTMNMTTKERLRATMLMGALNQTMNNPEPGSPPDNAGSTGFPSLTTSLVVASFLAFIVLNFAS